LAGDALDAPATPGGADVDAFDQDDDAGFAEARVLEPLLRDHALGVGIVGAVGVEAIGDAGAEHTRGDEEDRREDQHPLRPPFGEPRQTLHHFASSY
jgi:hypothetical protein